jgi:tyrosine decarboxylase
LPLDADEFRRQGRHIVDFIADYYDRIDEYPVRPAVSPGFLSRQLPDVAPSWPEPDALGAVLRDVRDLILPGVTHWQSPRHFAHFAATASNVGALGEALAAGLNINPFTWAASPAATELEVVVTDWLGKALHLPDRLLFCGGGGGTLLGTSCEAMLSTVVAARDRKLAEVGEKRMGDLVVYFSDQTHFSFKKAAHIAGVE